MNEIRSIAYWTIDSNCQTKKIIFRGVTFRSLRGKMAKQKMAHLPVERVSEAPFFISYDVNMFESFLSRERRSDL